MARTALGLGLVAVIILGVTAQQAEPESVCAKGYEEARRSVPLSDSEMAQYGRSEVGSDEDSTISKTELSNSPQELVPRSGRTQQS